MPEKSPRVNLDAVNLRALVQELQRQLTGAFLQKFSQLTDEDFLLSFRAPGDTVHVLLCLRPGESRLHRIESRPQARVPSSFAMLVRKHLQGRRLESLEQEGLERLVQLRFGGDRPRLIAELLGQHNNLLLVDPAGRILGAHRTAHDPRGLRPGRIWEPPSRPGRPWANQLTGEELVERLAGAPLEEIPKHVFGLPRQVLAELAGRGAEGLAASWNRFWAQLDDPDSYRPGIAASGALTLQARPGEPSYPSMQQAAAALWGTQSRLPGFEQQRSELSRRLTRRLDKARRKLAKRRQDREKASQAEELKHRADLLLANLSRVETGVGQVELPDWTGEPVRIPLDPRLTPSQNAQSFYARYRKLKRAAEILEIQVAAAADEVALLEELEMALGLAEEPLELEEVGRQLAPRGNSPAPEAPSSGPRRFRFGPFELLVGRNPRQNDQLTTRLAARDDLWFHARNIPGSHVILRTAGRPPEDGAVLAAALLAGRYSRAAESSKVPVDYTLVRHVRKPPGSPPGKMIYRHEKTIMVDPQAIMKGLEAGS